MKHFAKMLSLLLALTMLLGMLPLQVLAAENDTLIADDALDEQTEAVAETLIPTTAETAAEEQAVSAEGIQEVAEEVEAVGFSEIVEHSGRNPLLENLTMEEPSIVTDSLEPRSSKSYSDYTICHLKVRSAMTSREPTATIYCYLNYDSSMSEEELAEYLNLAWEVLALKAMENDGSSYIAGDYLAVHVESIGGTISLDSSNTKKLYLTLNYAFTYYSTAEEEQQVDLKLAQICNEYNMSHPQTTAYQKVKFVYEYVTQNVKYDTEGANDPNDRKKHTAYGALIENSAVDSGYAALFYRMIMELGVRSAIVIGEGETPRYWNLVQIDYQYYNVDAVLDAQQVQNGQDYAYFLKCNETFASDHTPLEGYDEQYNMAPEDYDTSIISKGSRSNVEWVLDHNGTLTFTGTGKLGNDFESTNVKNYWNNYNWLIKKVVVEEGITEIGSQVFRNSNTITAVSLPSTVTNIGEYAFENCTALTKITIPSKVKSIQRSAFAGCTSLETVTFLSRDSEATLTLSEKAFSNCTALQQIVVPHNTTSGYAAFEKCTALTYVELGKGTVLNSMTFDGCTALKTAVLPEDLVKLSQSTFYNCSSLENIVLPKTLEVIENGAFWNCDGLNEITIPGKVRHLNSDVFTGSDNLRRIIFEGPVPNYIDYGCFEYLTTTVYYPANELSWTEELRQNCGGEITWKAYNDLSELEAFSIEYANMTLGNSLAMNFAFPQSGTDNWEGAYAQVAKTYADGRGTKVINIPISQWGTASIGGEPHYTLTFNGIAAKEMADEIYITVYNGDKNPISNTWEDSVRAYAMRTLANPATTAATATMVVDMLNYGAAAQQSFGYDTGNLANSKLTPQQAALATPSAWAEDGRIKGENYLGTQLRLESQIMLRMAFSNVTADMTAQVSFTDHYDRPQSYTIPGSDFEINDNTAVIMIDKIVLADARNDVTVQIMDSDGNVVASATDSVAGYIARMRQEVEDPLYESILKFADSAYLYFHPGAQLPTAPEHSDLYIPGLSQDQAVAYFNEVCFGSEYGSNTPYICKWTEPISYAVYGDPTDTDMQMLENFVAELNTIEGFPGLTEYTGSGYVDWEIHFCQEDEMAGIVGDWAAGGGFEGAVTIWYNNQCEITDSAIAIRVDLDQATRSSVILEEIYNGLGPLMDTEEREDSIIYQYGSSVTELSDIDWLILQLLYSEEVKAGMDKVECEAVLRSLYW